MGSNELDLHEVQEGPFPPSRFQKVGVRPTIVAGTSWIWSSVEDTPTERRRQGALDIHTPVLVQCMHLPAGPTADHCHSVNLRWRRKDVAAIDVANHE